LRVAVKAREKQAGTGAMPAAVSAREKPVVAAAMTWVKVVAAAATQ
jgi:hypothetical protein